MAIAVYPKYKKALLEGHDPQAADLRVVLIDTADYTYDDTDEFLSDVAAAAKVAVSGTLQSIVAAVSGANATLAATDITINSVTGDPVEAVIIYDHNGGADSARRLLCFIDKQQDGSTNIAFTPNGSNVLVDFLAAGFLEI